MSRSSTPAFLAGEPIAGTTLNFTTRVPAGTVDGGMASSTECTLSVAVPKPRSVPDSVVVRFHTMPFVVLPSSSGIPDKGSSSSSITSPFTSMTNLSPGPHASIWYSRNVTFTPSNMSPAPNLSIPKDRETSSAGVPVPSTERKLDKLTLEF